MGLGHEVALWQILERAVEGSADTGIQGRECVLGKGAAAGGTGAVAWGKDWRDNTGEWSKVLE